MRPLLKTEEDGRAKRLGEYEDVFKRRIASSTWKRLRVESKSWRARAEIGRLPPLPSLLTPLLSRPHQ